MQIMRSIPASEASIMAEAAGGRNIELQGDGETGGFLKLLDVQKWEDLPKFVLLLGFTPHETFFAESIFSAGSRMELAVFGHSLSNYS